MPPAGAVGNSTSTHSTFSTSRGSENVLHYLDTAIGFAVIMLLLSLLVTTAVQSLIAMLNLRGSNLKWGLELLLKQINPDLKPEITKEIADKVLIHPGIASTGLLRLRRWAVAI